MTFALFFSLPVNTFGSMGVDLIFEFNAIYVFYYFLIIDYFVLYFKLLSFTYTYSFYAYALLLM